MKPGLTAALCFLFVTLIFSSHALAQSTLYTDRSSFRSANPGLPVEDFENLSGSVDATGVDLLSDVVDSFSNIGPIEPGDILTGLVLTTIDDGLDGLVLLNPASPEGVPSNSVGPNLYVDSLRLEFVPAVDAVGFDLFSFENEPGTVDVTFFNGNVVLAATTVTIDLNGSFVGVSTVGPTVSHIVLSNETDIDGGTANGELVDDVEFRLTERCLLGDINLDGWVNLMDVHPLIALILDDEFQCSADVNLDGAVDLLDIEPFVEIMSLH